MTDNITPLFKADPLFIGPFQESYVVVDGRFVPRLSGRQNEDGTVDLVVDRRFGATFSDLKTASQAARLIAQASAIAAGYPHFAADSKDQPFAAQSFGVSL